MTRARLAPLLWIAYLVVPVQGWGLFHGRPLGGFDALVLAALCWLWWRRKTLPLPLLAVVALIAKIALGATLLAPRGFDAKYYANAAFAGAGVFLGDYIGLAGTPSAVQALSIADGLYRTPPFTRRISFP